ncbi:MAG: dicarboxylate/amino acid:cation symporter [Flavobacteriales bacterium]|nr:dicarboxylate/amino acid:cation symporter [Flavobacteriales bacterium]
MKKVALHWKVIIALILGLIYAYFAVTLNSETLPTVKFTKDFISPFGKIFINILKTIAVPLVLFSIISGIVSLKDIKKLGRIGTKTLLLYITTTMFAVSLGLVLVNVWKPGKQVAQDTRLEKRIEYELWRNENNIKKLDNIDELNNPKNTALVETVSKKNEETTIDDNVQQKISEAKKSKDAGPLFPLVDAIPENIFEALLKNKMLQIISFAIFFGVVMVQLPEKTSKPMADFIESASTIFIRMVEIVMLAMPYFVFALMAGTMVEMAGNDIEKLVDLLGFLLHYGGVVVLGLILMAFVIYPTLIKLFTKKMTIPKFLKGINQAQLTAFSTSSSAATLPVTMECVHENLEVPESTSSFVLPIGATVNMDGTSLYQAVAVVAMAQLHAIDLTVAQQLTIVFTATLASVGAAAVPSAGLVLMVLVLESVGLNPAWIAIIMPIDRILDMCRTVVNVTGDATVAVIVSEWEE